MTSTLSDQLKVDPSDVRQNFSNVNIKLLCCRYWLLHEWRCVDLSAPFWRIYHNNTDGASIQFNGEEILLHKQTIIVVPPNTSFSTKLGDLTRGQQQESIIGRKMEKTDFSEFSSNSRQVDHLFIHFSLGFPQNFAQAGIYSIPVTSETASLIEKIQKSCINDHHFNFLDCLLVKHLITGSLLSINKDIWKVSNIDARVFSAMKTIERHLMTGISNIELANFANMAVNSFSRLFKADTGFSIQQYITKTKIDAACNLMHHTSKSIDEIAYSCGFYDRHHFSKVFKKQMKMNPSYYMRNLKANSF